MRHVDRNQHRRHPPPTEVRVECTAVVHVADDHREPARVALVGGRPRYSVGGEVREGLRWWQGEVDWLDTVLDLRRGTEIRIELDDGRSAVAVVVDTSTDRAAVVRGIGPPPFDVP